MGRREQAKEKFKRWAFNLKVNKPFYATGKSLGHLQRKRECIREVLEDGRAKLRVVFVNPMRVDVVWPRPVGLQSAVRIAHLATKRDPRVAPLLSREPEGLVDVRSHIKDNQETTCKIDEEEEKENKKSKGKEAEKDKKDKQSIPKKRRKKTSKCSQSSSSESSSQSSSSDPTS